MKATLTAVLLLLIAAVVTSGLWVPLYNEYASPLGRLRHSIAVGDPYLEVKKKFESYQNSEACSEMQFNSGKKTEDFEYEPIEESEFLFLYDVCPFEVQLGVLFDHSRKLSSIYFIRD